MLNNITKKMGQSPIIWHYVYVPNYLLLSDYLRGYMLGYNNIWDAAQSGN
jgi:hypothetical protein